jgi:predicted outer membrane protein
MIAALLLAPGAMLMAQDTSTTQVPQRDTIRGYNQQNNQQNMGRRDTLQGDNALVMKIHKINQMEIRAGQLAQRNSSTPKVKSYGQQLVRDHQAADQKITTMARSLGVTFPREGMDSAGKYNQDRMSRDTAYGQSRDTTQRAESYPRDQYPRDTTQGRYGQPADTTQGAYGQHGQMQGQDQDGQEHAQLQRLSTLQGTQFDAEFANFMAQGHDKAIKMLEQAQSNVQNAQLRTFITSTLPTLRTHLKVAQSLGGSTAATTTSSQ